MIIDYSDIPVWQPFSAIDGLKKHVMADGGRLVMDNWDAKYLNIRMDMRTGNVLISEGNIRDARKPRYIVVKEG